MRIVFLTNGLLNLSKFKDEHNVAGNGGVGGGILKALVAANSSSASS